MMWGTIFPQPPIMLFGIVLYRIQTIVCSDVGQYVFESVSELGRTLLFALGRIVGHDVLPPTA